MNSLATYSIEGAVVRDLDVAPRLASWDATGTPSQVRLQAFLNHVSDLLGGVALPRPLAIQLDVGLPANVGTSTGHDVDNYLLPLARHLSHPDVRLVRGSKRHHSPSRLTVGRAERVSSMFGADGWCYASVTTHRSADTRAWKKDVRTKVLSQVAQTEDMAPIDLEIAFRVGPRRNWLNLWKPTIDSLAPILGEGPREFSPRDDLIVSLGLHLEVDHEFMNEVQLGIWWRQSV